MNDEGNFWVHHDEENGYVDMNPLQSIRPKGLDIVIPEEGKFTIFPSWLKHSVTPFFGEGESEGGCLSMLFVQMVQTIGNLKRQFPEE